MPDALRRTERIWMFGKRYDFRVYSSSVALDPFQYRVTGGAAERRQKNQIVLHFTAGNGPGQGSIEWWNEIATRPAWLCPQRYTGAHHTWGAAHRLQCPHNSPTHNWTADAGACPVHHVSVPVTCPNGHGAVIPGGRKNASAHYIVERAAHRTIPAELYSDVIEVVDSDYVTWHGGPVNDNSIGIEHSNIGTDWSAAQHDTFTGAGAAKRPTDRNRWLRFVNPGLTNSNLSAGSTDFQAYQEEQYLAMILLLRSLCIKHRIPRRFLGDIPGEKFQRWWHNLPAGSEALTRSKLMRFRGILSHMNCHDTKTCGGPAMHRNRLFRGIIDEWWLPVELEGAERPYYFGPFDPQPDLPSFVRWLSGAAAPQADLFRNANVDALQDTKSYFDLDRVEWYYSLTETLKPGGTYPIGTNKIWHGGIHLEPPEANRKVYAAASGTIVAARLGSDADVESDLEYGSQRFVLIRHCVYLGREADPSGAAGDTRTAYSSDPTYFFTLYMHLAPFAKLDGADDANPPWFNYWRRRNPAVDATKVFCPDVQLSVGDWIGHCGSFRGRRMIHFETVSRQELTVAPWNESKYRAYDGDADLLCNAKEIDRFVIDYGGKGITTLDVLFAAKELRNVKSYHKSEWALSSADSLKPLIAADKAREAKWNRIKHFMWVADAVAACPDLTTQLCDATGMMWFYHPITFMAFVNRLVLAENKEVSETDSTATNVIMEGDYLTNYVNFASGGSTPAQADSSKVQPFDVSSGTFEYHFSRSELACLIPGAHSPGPTPPNSTRFHLGLLNVIEDIRVRHNAGLRVGLSHVCDGHNVAANTNRCVLATVEALNSHAAGHAIDLSPTGPNPAKCRSLWNDARAAVTAVNMTCGVHGGEPSQADLPEGFAGVAMSTTPAVETKLNAGTALTAAEAASFRMHLRVLMKSEKVVWECWIRKSSKAKSVMIRTYDHEGSTYRGIVGVYGTKEDAKAESQPGFDPSGPSAAGWEAWVWKMSSAWDVRLQTSGIVGVFYTMSEAETYKQKDTDPAWPVEV